MILVGNKCDNNKVQNKIVAEKAKKISQEVFKCSLFETSAKDNINVNECFNKIFELIHEQLEEAARREAMLDISKRRNSTISFVRRISVNVNNAKQESLSRRFSEPAVVVSNDQISKADLEAKSRLYFGRKKQKNCVIS